LFDAVNPRPDIQLLNPPSVAYVKPSLAVAEAFEREIHQHLKDKARVSSVFIFSSSSGQLAAACFESHFFPV
jgi:hypothetical protein